VCVCVQVRGHARLRVLVVDIVGAVVVSGGVGVGVRGCVAVVVVNTHLLIRICRGTRISGGGGIASDGGIASGTGHLNWQA